MTMLGAVVMLSSCGGKTGNETAIRTIKLSECQVKEFTWESRLGNDARIIELADTSKEYSFTEISKLVLKDDKLYISDWITRRIITFDMNGNPVSVLNRRGRGPEEYLRITDFDVDDRGGVWLLDGQQDVVKHYASDGRFLSQAKTGDCQYSNLLFNDGYLYLGVSYWDKTDNKDCKVVKADTSLNIVSRYGKMPETVDPDFTYPSRGFSYVNGEILYNNPIDDYVVVLDSDGYKGDVFFDFGSKSVPDEIRKAIEPHLKDMPDYTFLVNCIGVSGDIVVGTLREGDGYVDFLLDEKNKTIYKHSLDATSLRLAALSDSKIVLTGLSADSERTVIVVVPFDNIKNS